MRQCLCLTASSDSESGWVKGKESRTSCQKFDHEPEFFPHDERCIVCDNVFMITTGHRLNLLQQLVHRCVPLFQVDLFDGTPLLSRLAVGCMNCRRGSHTCRFPILQSVCLFVCFGCSMTVTDEKEKSVMC